MNCCSDKQETLLLDVYGELSPEKRPAWEEHLASCKNCFLEREVLLELLNNVKEAMPVPSLLPEDADELKNDIIGKLKEKHDNVWFRKPFIGRYLRPVHAVAACCILIIAFGWIGIKGLQHTPSVTTSSDVAVEEQMLAKDLELLRNMEILEEMETLEKLGSVMDKDETAI